VGSQIAQGLLTTLDRAVLLDGLVAQFFSGKHREHLDPGRLPGWFKGEDRLERLWVVSVLAMEHRDPLRRDDLSPGDPLAVVGAVRSVHHEVPFAADEEFEGPRGGGE